MKQFLIIVFLIILSFVSAQDTITNKDMVKLEKALAGGRFKNVIEQVDQLLLLDSTLDILYFKRGMAFDYLNYREEALADYYKTLQMNENYFDAYYNMGDIYLEKSLDHEKEYQKDSIYFQYLSKAQQYLETFVKSINHKEAIKKLQKIYDITGASRSRIEEIITDCYKDLEVIDQVFQEAQFPDGNNKDLIKYIKKHYSHTKRSWYVNAQGKVIIQFVVDKEGAIHCPRIMKSQNGDIDAEMIKVIKKLPDFKPALDQELNPVASIYELSIKLEFFFYYLKIK